MRIGALDKRIIFQLKTKTSDGMGGFVATWVDNVTLWAAIWPVSAKEVVQGKAPVMLITHRIRVRYKAGLASSYRVKFGTRYFNIVAITNPNEAGKWLDIMCKEAQ